MRRVRPGRGGRAAAAEMRVGHPVLRPASRRVRACVCAYLSAFVRSFVRACACVRAYVRACVRVRVRVRACVRASERGCVRTCEHDMYVRA
jgi:hypothetical protein